MSKPRSRGRDYRRITHRQLTIGECLAFARYGPSASTDDGRFATVEETLAFIDRIEVCTTCGWSRSIHEAVRGAEHRIGTCEHWTREL